MAALSLLFPRPAAWTHRTRYRAPRIRPVRRAMRRIAADAAETPSKSKRAPPPPTEFYSGSESGDELRGYDPPHGFGVDVATLRQLCEATPGEGRVARISALGGLDELARRLRADTVSGLATAPREDTSGLHVVDADARAAAFGVNAVPSSPSKSFVDLLLRALDDDTLRILVACGALSLLLELGFNTDNHNPHAWVEGAAILAAVAIVSVVTALNDGQKQAQFEALNAAAAEGYVVRARRGGDECAIGVADVLVGDLLLLDAGDVAPADCVLVSTCDCAEVTVDESHLTGESDDVRKTSAGAPVLLSGSKVLEGQCEAMAVAVGVNSQAGLVTAMVRGQDGKGGGELPNYHPITDTDTATTPVLSTDDKTVLQGKLETLALAIGKVGFYAGAFVTLAMSASYTQRLFLSGVFVGGVNEVAGSNSTWTEIAEQYLRFVITGVTVVVVAVPEGLPLAVTLALAFSVKRMLDDNNLVRYLGACETMGGATTILTDKTGTLTRNEMRVTCAWAGQREFTFEGKSMYSCVDEAGFDALTTWDPGDSGDTMDVFDPAFESPVSDELWRGLADAVRSNSTARERVKVGGAGSSSSATGDQSETAAKERFGSRTELALLAFASSLDTSSGSHGGVERIVPFTAERRRTCSFVWVPDPLRDESDDDTCEVVTDTGSGDLSVDCEEENTDAFHHDFGHFRQYVKGAVLDVLPLCTHVLDADGKGVSTIDVGTVNAVAKGWADLGLRVLLVARKDCDAGFDCKCSELKPGWESGLTLIAAVAMEDPLRDEVPASIARCQDAGITVRMVTGDSLATATSVAKQCGILPADYGSADESEHADRLRPRWLTEVTPWSTIDSPPANVAMDAETFRKLVCDPVMGEPSQTAFDAVWPDLRVLARSSPRDKFALVSGIKRSRRFDRREVVAVTGDGTNDAPALRAADVGFAMGVAGTRIARDASDILLLDDDFSSAVAAVKWGRNVYFSVQKFLQFQLTVNVSAVTTACVCALVVGESPLTAIQMLWLNLMMDSLAGLALATDYPGDDLLSRPPIASDEPIVSTRMRWNIGAQAGYQLAAMATLVWYGDVIFDVPSGRNAYGQLDVHSRWEFAGAADYFDLIDGAERVLRDAPTVHYTLVFNAFVLMQLANQLNCRAVDGRFDVFAGVTSNRVFCGIFAAELAMQVAIVELGGEVFHTRPLTGGQWAACVGIAVASLPLRAGVTWWLNRREGAAA